MTPSEAAFWIMIFLADALFVAGLSFLFTSERRRLGAVFTIIGLIGFAAAAAIGHVWTLQEWIPHLVIATVVVAVAVAVVVFSRSAFAKRWRHDLVVAALALLAGVVITVGFDTVGQTVISHMISATPTPTPSVMVLATPTPNIEVQVWDSIPIPMFSLLNRSFTYCLVHGRSPGGEVEMLFEPWWSKEACELLHGDIAEARCKAQIPAPEFSEAGWAGIVMVGCERNRFQRLPTPSPTQTPTATPTSAPASELDVDIKQAGQFAVFYKKSRSIGPPPNDWGVLIVIPGLTITNRFGRPVALTMSLQGATFAKPQVWQLLDFQTEPLPNDVEKELRDNPQATLGDKRLTRVTALDPTNTTTGYAYWFLEGHYVTKMGIKKEAARNELLAAFYHNGGLRLIVTDTLTNRSRLYVFGRDTR